MSSPPSGDAARPGPTADRATYTVPEAAALFGATRNCLYRAARRGEIRSIRIGERIYLSRTDVDELLAVVSGPWTGQPDTPQGTEWCHAPLAKSSSQCPNGTGEISDPDATRVRSDGQT